MLALVFPGQGTVRVGMGRELRADGRARRVFAEASDILGRDVAGLCARGPLGALVATENAQIAVTVCNLAALAVVRGNGLRPDLVAGHSVGELSALYAAGVLDLAETLRLVDARARLMADVPGRGGMRAVLGLGLEVVEELAGRAVAPGQPLVVGLENAAGHVVVSGDFAALDRIGALALAAGARRVVDLVVGNAFHSPLMQPAVAGWARILVELHFRAPACPVLPNVTAEPTTDPDVIRAGLLDQLAGRVRWADTMQRLAALGATDCVEVGDSKALTGFARAALPDVRCVSTAEPAGRRLMARGHAASVPVPVP